ncbi:MAG: UDP-2,3-diacylglucosamine diphosphatase [Planctomycetota bacterium]
MHDSDTTSIRTLLISDVHLGCKHAQTEAFLSFLRSYRPKQIYLVGDFIDGWKCNRGWHWTDECDQILDHLAKLIREGTEVFYVPGNHDSFLRNSSYQSWLPEAFANVRIADEFVYETVGGWRFLVTHGDLFDWFETRAQWISKGTSWLYDAILSINRWLTSQRGDDAANPYAACAAIKHRVKSGVRFISRFEDAITRHAHSRRCEGVICGHIHTPDIVRDGSTLYCNTGDWVENCTGLVEQHDGTICLVSKYKPSQSLALGTHQRRAVPVRTAELMPVSESTQPMAQPVVG